MQTIIHASMYKREDTAYEHVIWIKRHGMGDFWQFRNGDVTAIN